MKNFQSFINIRPKSLKVGFSVALAEYRAGPPSRFVKAFVSTESDEMAATRALTTMLLPPSGSMPPSVRNKAVTDAKDYQRVIETSLAGSGSPEFQYTLQELIGKGTYGRVYLALVSFSRPLRSMSFES